MALDTDRNWISFCSRSRSLWIVVNGYDLMALITRTTLFDDYFLSLLTPLFIEVGIQI